MTPYWPLGLDKSYYAVLPPCPISPRRRQDEAASDLADLHMQREPRMGQHVGFFSFRPHNFTTGQLFFCSQRRLSWARLSSRGSSLRRPAYSPNARIKIIVVHRGDRLEFLGLLPSSDFLVSADHTTPPGSEYSECHGACSLYVLGQAVKHTNMVVRCSVGVAAGQ